MKKTLTLFVITLGLSITVTGQQPEFQWAIRVGGDNTDYVKYMTVDISGNVYTIGSFSGTVDFDPGSSTNNLTGGGNFISKLNASGNFVWARQGGATMNAVASDISGNVYIVGYFSGIVDFDFGPGTYNLTSTGKSDIFIVKMDTSGNFVWVKQLGGTEYNECHSITIDTNGNIYITGYFSGTSDFDPGSGTYNLSSAGSIDHFVIKLDASGSFIWAKQFAGPSTGNESYITIDALGNVYTVGSFYGTVDFDPGAGTYNLTPPGYASEVFISKLNNLGNFVWARNIGGAGHDYGRSIAVDASGNVYTTGRFSGVADFDPGSGTYNLLAAGSYDIFISKLDASGNFVWAKQIGGSQGSIPSGAEDEGKSIALDAAGNVYTTGLFAQTADFDPGPGTYNLTAASAWSNKFDVFISKLDASGNFVWAGRMGGNGDDYGKSIALDVSGNLYTAGDFQQTADFDPDSSVFNLTRAGISNSSFDIFVQKLGFCTGSSQITIETQQDTVCAGTPCLLSVTGGSGIIQWQSSTTPGIFNNIPGATGISYTSQDTLTRYFRVYSSGTCGTDTSVALRLVVKPSPVADFLTSGSGGAITFTNQSKGATVYHWDFGDGTTDTEQNPVHTYSTADTFHVCLTVYNGSNCSFTMCKDIETGSVTGISKADRENNIRIYPNPFSCSITTEQRNMNKPIQGIELYDLLGRKIYSEYPETLNFQTPNFKLQIEISALPNGMYFVKVKTKEGDYIERVIKQ